MMMPAASYILAAAIEDLVRAQLQVRIAVSVLAAGSLPKSVYKNPLTVVLNRDDYPSRD